MNKNTRKINSSEIKIHRLQSVPMMQISHEISIKLRIINCIVDKHVKFLQ